MIGLPCARAKRLGEIVRPICLSHQFARRLLLIKNIDPDEHGRLCPSVPLFSLGGLSWLTRSAQK